MRTLEQLADALYPTLAKADQRAATALRNPTLTRDEVDEQLAMEPAAPVPPSPRRPAGVLGGIPDAAWKLIEEETLRIEREAAEEEAARLKRNWEEERAERKARGW